MNAILATVRGFLRKSFTENFLLVLGIAVAAFMGATVTGAISAYSAQMERELDDPRFGEVTVSPAIFRDSQSEAATKIDQAQGDFRRFAFASDAAAKAMAEVPAISATYSSQREYLRTGDAWSGPGPLQMVAAATATSRAAPGGGTAAAGSGGAAATASSGAAGTAFGEGAPPELQEMRAAMEEERAAQAAEAAAAGKLDSPTIERLPGRSVSPAFFSSWGLKAAEGSLFMEADVQALRNVMVLGSNLAKSLYEDGVSLGKKIMIEGRIYGIIGILEESGLTDSSGSRSVDDMAFIPPRAGFIPGMGRGRPVMSLTFFVEDRDRLDQAVSQLQAHFDREMGEGQVRVESRRSALNARRSAQNALLGAVAALALLCMVVASLNIFNVSSIKTIRRRQALGILRAIGASRVSALSCFLVEIAALALGGTLLGLGIALPLAPATAGLLSAGAASAGATDLLIMALAGLASMALPLAAGLFPAWRILGQAPADLVRPE